MSKITHSNDDSTNKDNPKEKLLEYLNELKKAEARLWGVKFNHLATGSEEAVEDANHLIYMLNNKKDEELEKLLGEKSIKEFLDDIRNLRNDLIYLKKEIKNKDNLKNKIMAYTITLVEKKNYHKMEEVFLLEKQLNEVIEKQEGEFDVFFKNFSNIKVDIKAKKTKVFLSSLVKVRRILAGHLDHHNLWEEERRGYSNISNILDALTKVVHKNI